MLDLKIQSLLNLDEAVVCHDLAEESWGLFWDSLSSRIGEVDIVHAKLFTENCFLRFLTKFMKSVIVLRVSGVPLKIVHEGPGKQTDDIHTIQFDSWKLPNHVSNFEEER